VAETKSDLEYICDVLGIEYSGYVQSRVITKRICQHLEALRRLVENPYGGTYKIAPVRWNGAPARRSGEKSAEPE